MPEIHDFFDPKTEPLRDSNLIEASAGTGKTYSLALLALRLVMSGTTGIDQILMVTFTNAAVAELEIRVRAFIRKALIAAREDVGDIEPDILELVQLEIQNQGREKVVAILSDAELMLDQTAIMTIHGFCQKSLSEYAFETKQLFRASTLDPEEFGVLVTDTFNQIWRNYITTIPVDLLTGLIANGLVHSSLLAKVNKAISGNSIYLQEAIPNDFLTPAYFESERERIRLYQISIQEIENKISIYLDVHEALLLQSLTGMKKTPEELIEAIGSRDVLFVTDYALKNIKKLPSEFLPLIPLLETLFDKRTEQRLIMLTRVNQLALFAYTQVKVQIDLELSRKGHMTFDDMISRLHDAVCTQQHPSLIQKLRERYKAVFVDEFQDTDRMQYEIFARLFQHPDYRETPLFYIGDPKQLIYGWRKADLNTYFRAADSVDHIYRMKTNFRSHPDLIKAMNYFFDPAPGSNFFHFDEQDVHRIEYEQVDAVIPTRKPRLVHNGEQPPAIQFVFSDNKKQVAKDTAALVRSLLDGNQFKFDIGGRTENIKPGDIGIIVRKNDEGDLIKDFLSEMKIPAVTIREVRILQSEEAKEIYYLLNGAFQLTRSSINRALLTTISGWTTEQLMQSDEEKVLERFREYHDSWKEKGVYLMLRKCLSDCNLISRLFQSDYPPSERFVSNCFQLIELLHTTEQKKSFSPEELMHWLKKGIDGELKSGDEYVQRLESDAEAVNIITVHKSKGLEYKVVLLPYMDLTVKTSKEVRFRSKEGIYYTAESDLISNELADLYKKQEEQENKRLLYVAVTRACAHCFIFTKPLPKTHKPGEVKDSYSVVRKTLVRLKEEQMVINKIGYAIPPSYNPKNSYQSEFSSRTPVYSPLPQISLKDKNWQMTSYSSLNPEHTPVVSRNSITEDLHSELDRFVFKDLPRGAHIGNLLHLIFEKIDFSDEKYWSSTIDKAVRAHIPSAGEKWITLLTELIRQIVRAKIPAGDVSFSLNEIAKSQRLNELEFDLPLTLFNTSDFMQLPSPVPLRMRAISELEGILNGKIDLFFEHKGRYYLLDWKSNFLGSSLNDYTNENIFQSMEQHNYFLQYHLYTLTLYRYLTQRLKGFDYDRDFGGVAYVYMRGVRADSSNGIYFHKPELQLILKMESLMLKKQLSITG
jgi:exodeoxyribonuclease V beta subunit